MEALVFKGNEGQALTSSLLVAEKFSKEHRSVLSSIRELVKGCAENYADPLFVETTFTNEQNGQQYPMFVMNRDGFTLLAMGFTGKKALKFKLEYIEAFNQMEAKLKEQSKPLTGAEYLLQQAKLMVEQERRLTEVENRLNEIDKEREENGKQLLAISISTEKLPEIALRDKIRMLVNRYATAANIKQSDVWHKIYDQLYYMYHISIGNYKKVKLKESNLSIAERNGFLDKIYAIISNMLRECKVEQ